MNFNSNILVWMKTILVMVVLETTTNNVLNNEFQQ